MDLPFSRERFFEVFAAYHRALWPAPLVLWALAAGCFALAVRSERWGRGAGWVLAVLWAWMGLAYQIAFFTRINPAAWLFGAAFVIAAAAFARHARAGTLEVRPDASAAGIVGSLLVAYGLVGYPLVGWLAGHRYPMAPTFGLPCPTTVFTLGMLLLARRPVPAALWIVPLGWSAVGSVAAFRLGVVEDYGLLLAGVSTLAVLLATRAGELRTRLARRPGHGPRGDVGSSAA